MLHEPLSKEKWESRDTCGFTVTVKHGRGTRAIHVGGTPQEVLDWIEDLRNWVASHPARRGHV